MKKNIIILCLALIATPVIGQDDMFFGMTGLGAAADPFPTVDNWDVSTFTWVRTTNPTNESVPMTMAFGNNGTTMLVAGHTQRAVFQYTLSTPYDISTRGSGTQTIDWGGPGPLDFSYPNGMHMDRRGEHFYVLDAGGKKVYHYTCSTAWDTSTAGTYDDMKDISTAVNSPDGMSLSDDGLWAYFSSDPDVEVRAFPLSTAFNISTANLTSGNKSFSTSSWESVPTGIRVTPDGTKMFITGKSGDDVNEFTLSTPFDISSASFVRNQSFGGRQDNPYDIVFSWNAEYMFVIGTGDSDAIVQFAIQ